MAAGARAGDARRARDAASVVVGTTDGDAALRRSSLPEPQLPQGAAHVPAPALPACARAHAATACAAAAAVAQLLAEAGDKRGWSQAAASTRGRRARRGAGMTRRRRRRRRRRHAWTRSARDVRPLLVVVLRWQFTRTRTLLACCGFHEPDRRGRSPHNFAHILRLLTRLYTSSTDRLATPAATIATRRALPATSSGGPSATSRVAHRLAAAAAARL